MGTVVGKQAKPRKTAGGSALGALLLNFQGNWCGREDSNFHVLSDTTTSTLRVYQFRHDRTCCPPGSPGVW